MVFAGLLGVLATPGCAIDIAKPEPPYFDQFKRTDPEPPAAPSKMLDRQVASYSLPQKVRCLAWSPDGKFIAAISSGDGSELSLVETRSGRRRWTLDVRHYHTGVSDCALQFSPDSQSLFTGAIEGTGKRANDTLSVIDVKDGRVTATLLYDTPQYSATVAEAAVLSRDGRTIFALPFGQRQLVSFNVASGALKKLHGYPFSLRQTHNKGFYPNRLALDEARDRLIWSHSATVNVWKLSDGAPVTEFAAFNLQVSAMQLNARTGELVVGGSGVIQDNRDPDDQIRTYKDDTRTLVRGFDPATGKQLHTYVGPGYTVEGLSVSGDGKLVAAAKSSTIRPTPAYVHLWDADSGALLASKSFGQSDLGDIAFSPDGTLLAVAVDSRIRVFRLAHQDPRP